MQYEISEQTKNNLLLFLDRTTATGRVENQAFNEIIYILSNPIQSQPTTLTDSNVVSSSGEAIQNTHLTN